MSYQYDVLLKDGTVVDPVNHKKGPLDVAVAKGKIAEIAPEISPALAKECFYVKDRYVVPGIIDLHVHVSSWLGGRFGHRMMALAGVTTGLDMSGPVGSVLDIAGKYGVGLNLACLQYVRNGRTVKSNNPNKAELEALLHISLKRGRIGTKNFGRALSLDIGSDRPNN